MTIPLTHVLMAHWGAANLNILLEVRACGKT